MDNLTDRARWVLEVATQVAIQFQHDYIGTEHILYGITRTDTSVGATALRNLGLDLEAIRTEISRLAALISRSTGREKPTPPLPLTPQCRDCMQSAAALAIGFGHPYVGVEHLLLGIMQPLVHDTVAIQVLVNLGVYPELVIEEIYELLGMTPPARSTRKKQMRVNGFQIREAIKQWNLKREMAVKVFNDAGFAFDGETKTSPIEAAEAVRNSDEAVARLETFQQQFNSVQGFEFNGKTISLAQAVKMIAGIGRLENLWKTYASKGLGGNDHHRSYGETPTTIRKEGEIHAKRTLPLAECVANAAKYAKQQAALRALISSANGTQIVVPDDLQELFA